MVRGFVCFGGVDLENLESFEPMGLMWGGGCWVLDLDVG